MRTGRAEQRCLWCRYADVIVHRLLAAAIGLNRLPEDAKDGDRLHALASNLNLRHRNAQMAGRASVELHTLIFFKDREVIADARVTRVGGMSSSICKSWGLSIVIVILLLHDPPQPDSCEDRNGVSAK